MGLFSVGCLRGDSEKANLPAHNQGRQMYCNAFLCDKDFAELLGEFSGAICLRALCRKRAEDCFEQLFRKRELTEFCGKLGELCERNRRVRLAHKQ